MRGFLLLSDVSEDGMFGSGFTPGRVENGSFREPERSVHEYVSTGSAEDCHLQTGIA